MTKLDELRAAIGRYELSQQEHLSYEFDTERNGVLVTKAPLDPPPTDFSRLMSEAAHHLRSALDYIVYELSWSNHGSEVSGTQFPIEDREKGFAGRRKTYLGALSDAQVTVIEGLQPYKGCDWTERLRNFSNPDKHRRLTIITNESSLGVRLTPGKPGEFDGRNGSGRVYRTHSPKEGPIDMYVEYLPGTFIKFEDGTLVLETLEQLIARVRDTLETFAPEF